MPNKIALRIGRDATAHDDKATLPVNLAGFVTFDGTKRAKRHRYIADPSLTYRNSHL